MIIWCNHKGPRIQFISNRSGVIVSVKQLKLAYKLYLYCATIKSYILESCLYRENFST